MTERSYVELTMPSWAAEMAEDLLAGTAMRRIRQGELCVLRLRGERFEQLAVAEKLIERKLPFDARTQREEDGQCRSSIRKVRFDIDGAMQTDVEDIPTELSNVYLGLLDTVHTFGERAAVDAFLRAAQTRRAVEPLREVAPLPEQIADMREAEERRAKSSRLRWRLVR